MPTWAILYNPTSGRFRSDKLEVVRRALDEEGIDSVILGSEGPGHLVDLARDLEGVDRVAVYGGDGSLREVAKGLLGRDMPLAFLPGGSGNSTAREMGLPLDPAQAAKALVRGPVKQIRPGHLDGELFMNMAGVGFDGLAIHLLTTGMKGRLGPMSYILTGFRCLLHRHPSMRVETPSGTRSAIWAVGARTRHYAGILSIHPRANLLAPKLALTAVNGWMLLPFGIGRLLLRIPVRGPGLAFEEHDSFHIVANDPVHAHVDGDYLRQDTTFELGLMEQTLPLCFPSGG